jgi:hypothetical protein
LWKVPFQPVALQDLTNLDEDLVERSIEREEKIPTPDTLFNDDIILCSRLPSASTD